MSNESELRATIRGYDKQARDPKLSARSREFARGQAAKYRRFLADEQARNKRK